MVNSRDGVAVAKQAKETPVRVITDIGHRLREIRDELGLTQQQLAAQLGMSVKHLQRLEAGRNMHIDTLVMLAVRLGVPTRSFFDTPTSRTKRSPGRPPRSVISDAAAEAPTNKRSPKQR